MKTNLPAKLGICIQFSEPQLEQIRLPNVETIRIRFASQSAQITVRLSNVRLVLRLGLLPRFSQLLFLRKLRLFTSPNVCLMKANVPALFFIETVNAFILTIATTSKLRSLSAQRSRQYSQSTAIIPFLLTNLCGVTGPQCKQYYILVCIGHRRNLQANLDNQGILLGWICATLSQTPPRPP